MGFLWSTLVALLAIALAFYVFLPSPPTPPRSLHGTPYTSPGPVLANRIEGLVLDGLTIIPTTRLPRLKTRWRVPLTSYTISAALDITTSETVLQRCRVDSTTVRGRDVIQEEVKVNAEGVEVELQTSTGLRFEVALEKANPAGRPQRRWGWKAASSGRTEVALSGAALSASVQLVAGPKRSRKGDHDDASSETALSPRLNLLSTSFAPGHVSYLRLSPTFASFLPSPIAGYIFSTVVPATRNTSRTASLTSRLVAFLLDELIDSTLVDELLADLQHFLVKHLDGEAYGSISDDERDAVLADFFASSPPPSTSDLANPPAPNTASSTLRFSTLLHGPTLLTAFPLPTPPSTFLPIFSRSPSQKGGLRHTVLSSPLLNQVTTGPPTVDLGVSTFERIGFGQARVELAPAEVEQGKGSRELVLSVEGLDAVLTTNFSIKSELRTAPSLLLGTKNLTTPGSATTSVTTSSSLLPPAVPPPIVAPTPLRIFLPLSFEREEGRIVLPGRPAPTLGQRDGGVRLEGDFQAVKTRMKLESKLLGRVGERVVNAVIEGVESLLTPIASPLISYFLADLARLRMQKALDDVCARVRDEGGVEWASLGEKVEADGRVEPAKVVR
ncbi:hypothetical protein JCM11251_006153 [Rhodosporidiobolus azoricus]